MSLASRQLHLDPRTLTIDRRRVTLHITSPTSNLPFFHFTFIKGWLSNLFSKREVPHWLVAAVRETAGEYATRERLSRSALTSPDNAPRDPYTLGLVAVGRPFDDAGWTRLTGRIRDVGKGARRGGDAPRSNGKLRPIGGNYEFDDADTRVLAAPDIGRQSDALAAAGVELTLRFVTPLILPEARLARPLLRDPHEFACAMLRRMAQRVRQAAFGESFEQAGLPLPESVMELPATLTADLSRLVKVELPGLDKRPVGLLGSLTLHGVPEHALPWLVACHHVHVGESCRSGCGRFELRCGDVQFDDAMRPGAGDDPYSHRDLLAEACTRERIECAALEVRAFPGTPSHRLADDVDAACTVTRRMLDGTWTPAPLRRARLPKPDGSVRELSIPERPERIVQRALNDVLGPHLDRLFESCSFAYRRGWSRDRAREAIDLALQADFPFFFEGDVQRFFDRVAWNRLDAVIGAFLPDDRAARVLMQSYRAEVRDAHLLVRREMGLPQGSPLSPLLANLFLDVLDEAVAAWAATQEHDAVRFFRYADDFILLARTRDLARAGREAIAASLTQLGLELHDDKSRVDETANGFRFLGFSFRANARTVDEGNRERRLATGRELERVSDARREQRKSEIATHVARDDGDGPAAAISTPPGLSPLAPIALTDRAPIHVWRRGVTIRAQGDDLVIESKGKPDRDGKRATTTILRVPLSRVSQLSVYRAAVHVTLPAVVACATRRIPVFLSDPRGELQTAIALPADWTLWLAQAEAARDDARRLYFARAIVRAKLRNAAANVVRFGLGESAIDTAGVDSPTQEADGDGAVPPSSRERARTMRAVAEQGCRAESLDALRGLEGHGARLFFEALRASVGPAWHFERRARRPAPDPINALLSFAYTMSHRHIVAALLARGLNPRIGLFHVARGRHDALASDMLEEFRTIADRAVWSMISRGRVKPPVLAALHAAGGYRLPAEVRQALVQEIEDRLDDEVRSPSGARFSQRALMERQAEQLRSWILAPASGYVPFARDR